MQFVSDQNINKEISIKYKEILRSSYQKLNYEDKTLIRRALEVAIDGHKGQLRKSGEPFIFHPMAVATIVANEIGLGATSIASALLHDVVEDNANYSIIKIQKLFGSEIANIVEGLTKIAFLNTNTEDISLQAENFKKLILTLGDDARIVLIKIADRLHNMRTMSSVKKASRYKKSAETLYIYAPLAHRLGLFNIKSELEDMGLRYTEPEAYEMILRKVNKSKSKQQDYIRKFSQSIEEKLHQEEVVFRIKGRTKSIYSIYRKMKAQNIEFEEVYDRFAIRIIYSAKPSKEIYTAWTIYSIITSIYKSNNARMRNWLERQKSTGYQALHLTVIGLESKWVEIQIRSERMDEIAEKGYAAHYKYKNNVSSSAGIESWLNNLKDLLENPELEAVDFVEQFKLDLYKKEIYVYTPKGDVKELPNGASALDFAFSIHTQVGEQCTGVKINDVIKPINTKLKNGDIVEILTSQLKKPKKDWLGMVITSRAKSKIRSALKFDVKNISQEGEEILRRKLKQLKIPFNEETKNQLVNYFSDKSSQDVFYKAGKGLIDNKSLRGFANHRKRLVVRIFDKFTSVRKKKEKKVFKSNLGNSSIYFGKDEQQLEYQLATCCTPIEGDNVFGFISSKKGIRVHRENCPNALSMQSNFGHRIIEARWGQNLEGIYRAGLFLEGSDRAGMIMEIGALNKVLNIDVRKFNIEAVGEVFHADLIVHIENRKEMDNLIKKLKKIEGILKVKRVFEN